jgi:hypothetical protein
MASKYDLRRSSSSQGIPVKSSPQGGQGFDSEGFKGPSFETPEQRRERLRREEEERKERGGSGLLSDIGSLISEGFSKARSGAQQFAELSTFGSTDPEFQRAWMESQADPEARKDALLSSYLETYNEEARRLNADDDPSNDQRVFDVSGMGPDINIPSIGSGKMRTPQIGFNTGDIMQTVAEETAHPINVGIGMYGKGAASLARAGTTKLGLLKSGIQTPTLTKGLTTGQYGRIFSGPFLKSAITAAQAPLFATKMIVEPIVMRQASVPATVAGEVIAATVARRTFESVYNSDMFENYPTYAKAGAAVGVALGVGSAASIQLGKAAGKFDPVAIRAGKQQIQQAIDQNALDDTIDELDFLERRAISGNEIVPQGLGDAPVHVGHSDVVYVGVGGDGRPLLKEDGTLLVSDTPSRFGGAAADTAVVRKDALDMTAGAYENSTLPPFTEGTLRGQYGQNITRPKTREGLLKEDHKTLYHITDKGDEIRRDGMVRAITDETAGLQGGGFGGSVRGSVSTTTSREMAEQLQTDLRRRVEISQNETPEEITNTLNSWVAADTLKVNVDEPIFNANEIDAIVSAAQAQSGPLQLTALDTYFIRRKAKGIELFGEEEMPPVFRDTSPIHNKTPEEYRSLDPESIEILELDTALIPDGAFISGHGVERDYFAGPFQGRVSQGTGAIVDDPDALFETEIFADIPFPRTDRQLPLPLPPKTNQELLSQASGDLQVYKDTLDPTDYRQIVRRAQINQTLEAETASAAEILDLVKNQRKYMTADGTVIDWDEVPMLNTSTQMGRLIYDENVRRVELSNVYLSLRYANWEQNIFNPKDIDLPAGAGAGPNKVSFASLVQDGRWNPRLKELGVMKLNDGMYTFHGRAGRQIEEKLKQIRAELDLNVDIDELNGITPETIMSTKFQFIPPAVKKEMDAMWESGEMPYFGDVVERSLGDYRGYFPRFVTNPQKGITGHSGSHTSASYDKTRRVGWSLDEEGHPIGEYERQMWQMADEMAVDRDNPIEYLEDPLKILGLRLKATLDRTNAQWVEDAALSSPAFDGLGGYTAVERMQMDSTWQQTMDVRDLAFTNVKNILNRISSSPAQARAEQRRLLGVNLQRAAATAESSGLSPKEAELHANIIENGRTLAGEIDTFMSDADLMVFNAKDVTGESFGRSVPYGGPTTQAMSPPAVPVRSAPKTITDLKTDLKAMRKTLNDAAALGETGGPSSSALWSSVQELRTKYEKALDIYNNFLKGRPAVKRNIAAQSTFDSQTNRSNARIVRQEVSSMESEIATITLLRSVIEDKITYVNRLQPSGLPRIQAQLDKDLADLTQAEEQLAMARGMYNRALEQAGEASLTPISDSLNMVQQPRVRGGQTIMKRDGSGPVMETIVHPAAAQSGKVRFLANGAMKDRIYDDAFADQLDRVFRADISGQNSYERAYNNLNDVLRTINASADFSGLTIQGMLGAGLTPSQYASAVARSMAAVTVSKRFYTGFLVREEDTIREMTKWGRVQLANPDNAGEFLVPKSFGIGSAQFRLAGDVGPRSSHRKINQAVSNKVRKVLGSSQTFPPNSVTPKDVLYGSAQAAVYIAEKPVSMVLNASNLHFSAFGNIMRVHLWKNIMANKHQADMIRVDKGGKRKKEVYTRKDMLEVGEAINNLTGYARGEPSTIERTLLFAPRFFRAQTKSVATAIGDAGPAGDLARESYFRTLLMLGTLTAGLNYMIGEGQTDFVPFLRDRDGTYRTNPNFMKVHWNGRDYSLAGPLDSQWRMWMATALNTGFPVEAQAKAFSGKLGSAFDKALTFFVTQEGFGGEPMPRPIKPTGRYADADFDSRMQSVEQYGKGFLPFWMQNELDEKRDLGQSWGERYGKGPPPSMLLNMIGGKDAPVTVKEAVLGIARVRYPDRDYNLTNRPVPAHVRKEIYADNPDLAARDTRVGDAMLDAEYTESYQVAKTEIKKAEAVRDKELSDLGMMVLTGETGRNMLPREIGKIQGQHFGTIAGLRAGLSEFENAAGGDLFFEMAEKMFKAYGQATQPYTGLDFDKLASIQEAIEKEYGAELTDQFNDYVKDAAYPPAIQEVMEAGNYLREVDYWSAPNDVFQNALFAVAEDSEFRKAAEQDGVEAKQLVDAFAKILLDVFGRPIKTLSDLEIAARQNGVLGKWQYRALVRGMREVLEKERNERARNDPNLDLARVLYLGKYPALNPETTTLGGLAGLVDVDLNIDSSFADHSIAEDTTMFFNAVLANPVQRIDELNNFAHPEVAWKWVQIQQLLMASGDKLKANYRQQSQQLPRPDENPTGMGLTSDVESTTRSWSQQMNEIMGLQSTRGPSGSPPTRIAQ